MLLVAFGCSDARKPLALDPVPLMDDDRYDIPEPENRKRDDYYDILDYTIYQQIKQSLDLPRQYRNLTGNPKPAMNVTPFDEVQDSTWWTNRIGVRDLSIEEIKHGPNRIDGPEPKGPWTVVRAKTQGITPGFTIRDRNDELFVIKFDPLEFPELATGAEVISTKLFWALGYNVPENYLVHFDESMLVIGRNTTVRDLGRKRLMSPQDLKAIFDRVPQGSDGKRRAVASRYISGKPLGPPGWHGTRDDDPNDVIPHEHRRELRGYRVFSSWLHHNDCRQINAMDFYVEEDGRKFVKHYLIDFGATLGSRSNRDNLRSEGHEYLFDVGEMVKSFATLGLVQRNWVNHEYPEIHGVGRFDSVKFDPGGWKPDYQNPAFDNMTSQDAFWAAKTAMRFTDEQIRAAVETAEFSDSMATDYITRVLIERRDKLGYYWFHRVNPVSDFQVVKSASGVELRFADLAVQYDIDTTMSYRSVIRPPGGAAIESVEKAPRVDLVEAWKTLGNPAADDLDGRLLEVVIQSQRSTGKWSPATIVTLYLDPEWNALRVVHIERDA